MDDMRSGKDECVRIRVVVEMYAVKRERKQIRWLCLNNAR